MEVAVAFSGGDGLEGAHLVGAWTDHPRRGLGDFVPRSRKITERFRDDQSGLLAQGVQDLDLGMQLTQRCDAGGEEQRTTLSLAGVAEGPDGLPVARGHGSLERVLNSVIMANFFYEADGPRDSVERIVSQTE